MVRPRFLAALLLATLIGSGHAQTTKITVDASQVLNHLSPYLGTGACLEDVNHEVYGGIYSQMIFGESFQEPAGELAISKMWSAVERGSAQGGFDLIKDHPFVGGQSQSITFASGDGEIGVANASLNGWGMNLEAGRDYHGELWAKSAKATDLYVALESASGAVIYGEQKLLLAAGDWRKLEFTLMPDVTDTHGRFAIKLKSSGSVALGYVFLEPGAWGVIPHLPVRSDVVQGLIDQGVNVIRYGGSLVNAPEYRWKSMIGPRERRPPYRGTWYPYTSNGWGIPDFLNLCDKMGFVGIPAFNCNESAQDMADFVEYANGPASSTWGAKRAADGHPASYGLKYLEFGNEERVDDAYFEKFSAAAQAMWKADPNLVIVVGDFSYDHAIPDPFHFDGAASQITSLEAQQKILALAKQHDREVWFDVHIPTEQANVSSTLAALPTYVAAIDKVADGAKHKVVVFEYNANTHNQARALSNALATNFISRFSDQLAIATSANCLQPDGQNDNGWDQGLLFLNPSQVWLQPPGYITQMLSRNNLRLLLKCEAQSAPPTLDVIAKKSDDGKTLALQVVNTGDQPVATAITINGFTVSGPTSSAVEMAGPLDAVNTSAHPNQVVPVETVWPNHLANGGTSFTFKPHSFTILTFR